MPQRSRLRASLAMIVTVLGALVGRVGVLQVCGAVHDTVRSRAQLVAENALLRQQFLVLRRQVGQPQFTPAHRWWMVVAARFTKGWGQALLLV